MNILDIVYLDSSRLISLASQRHSGIAELVTHTTTAGEATEKTAGKFIGSVIDNSYSRQFQDAVQIRMHDHALTSFMASVSVDIVDLEAKTARQQAQVALEGGGLVRARGRLFVDDSKWLQENLRSIMTFFSLKEKSEKAQADQAKSITDTLLQSAKAQAKTNEQRRQIDAMAKQTIEKLSAATASQTAGYELYAEMTSALFQGSLECGVLLEAEDVVPTVVRAPLDREFLRENMNTFVDRYGTRSHVEFVLLGTVSRLGWQGEYYLSDVEKEAANAVKLGEDAATEPSDLGKSQKDPRQAVWQAQAMVVKFRRMLTAGHDKDSIFLSPLALYRELPVSDKSLVRE